MSMTMSDQARLRVIERALFLLDVLYRDHRDALVTASESRRASITREMLHNGKLEARLKHRRNEIKATMPHDPAHPVPEDRLYLLAVAALQQRFPDYPVCEPHRQPGNAPVVHLKRPTPDLTMMLDVYYPSDIAYAEDESDLMDALSTIEMTGTGEAAFMVARSLPSPDLPKNALVHTYQIFRA